MADKHPIQPLQRDDSGVLRFKSNAIVEFLLNAGPFDLNMITMMPFDNEDYVQLMQLIGYSLDVFGTLSSVSDEDYERAEATAQQTNE